MSSQEKLYDAVEKWADTYLFRSLREYFHYLKSKDISMHQAYALTFIYYNGPSKITEICDHMGVSAAAASQMADRLEKLNLAQRTTEPGDRRTRIVVLSDEGESFVKQSIEVRKSWLKQALPEITEEQFDQITNALNLLTSTYQKSRQ